MSGSSEVVAPTPVCVPEAALSVGPSFILPHLPHFPAGCGTALQYRLVADEQSTVPATTAPAFGAALDFGVPDGGALILLASAIVCTSIGLGATFGCLRGASYFAKTHRVSSTLDREDPEPESTSGSVVEICDGAGGAEGG